MIRSCLHFSTILLLQFMIISPIPTFATLDLIPFSKPASTLQDTLQFQAQAVEAQADTIDHNENLQSRLVPIVLVIIAILSALLRLIYLLKGRRYSVSAGPLAVVLVPQQPPLAAASVLLSHLQQAPSAPPHSHPELSISIMDAGDHHLVESNM